MKPRTLTAILSCSLILYLATSCALLPPAAPRTQKSPTATASDIPAAKSPVEKPIPERTSDNGLASPAFSTMDPFALSYLQDLATAVRAGDSGFLLSQGESWYEARLRPNLDDSSYLAYLYRLGPLSKDSPADSGSIHNMAASEIRSVRFTAWDSRGPVLEVRGTFILADGKSLPFTIDLLWKLDPPRILGMEP